jgi:hypothetical protein
MAVQYLAINGQRTGLFPGFIGFVRKPHLSKFKRFDVRSLLRRGGEPLPEILKRIHALKSDRGLTIVAPFLPSPLIELLGSQGFASKVEHGDGGVWIIYFWRRNL